MTDKRSVSVNLFRAYESLQFDLEQAKAELDQARAWAALWKESAKWYRERLWTEADWTGRLYIDNEWFRARAAAWKQSAKGWREDAIATEGMRQAALAETDQLRAEIKRLRIELAWFVGRSAESIMFNGSRRAVEALSKGTDDGPS